MRVRTDWRISACTTPLICCLQFSSKLAAENFSRACIFGNGSDDTLRNTMGTAASISKVTRVGMRHGNLPPGTQSPAGPSFQRDRIQRAISLVGRERLLVRLLIPRLD